MNERKLDIKIQQWKSRLLDLTKRNRLLNFKPNKSFIQIHTDTNQLFNLLQEFKSVRVNSLVNLEEEANKLVDKLIKQKDKNLTKEEIKQIKEESFIKTVKKFENQLNNIRLKAKSSIDEKGVNTLYLACGFLYWTEVDYSKDILCSPLFLIPISLYRESSKDPFYVQKLDDEILLNPVLEQKFKLDYGIVLTPIDQVDQSSFDELLSYYKNELKLEPSWKITNEAYIGLFSFSKLVMYKDFEEYEDLVKSNQFVQSLAGIKLEKDVCNSENIQSIVEYDKVAKSEESYQILDADSSQQEAILAAKNGVSFVMQGPPGTGKSQTIANIIAEFLAKGKKVLFVSEKKAALDVVKKRLDERGIGDYCLDLHNHNSNKKSILEELARTLLLKTSPSYSYKSFIEFDQIKKRLNSYVNSLHTKVSSLNETPQRIHGKLSELYDQPDLLFEIPNVENFDHFKLNEIKNKLRLLERLKPLLKSKNHHIWNGTLLKETNFDLETKISTNFRDLSDRLSQVYVSLSNLSNKVGIKDKKISLNLLDKVIQIGELLERKPNKLHNSWFNDKDNQMINKVFDHYKLHESLFSSYFKLKEELLKGYHEQILHVDLDEVKEIIFPNHNVNLVNDYSLFVNRLLSNESEIIKCIEEIENSYEGLLDTKKKLESIVKFELLSLNFSQINILDKVYSVIDGNVKPAEKWFHTENKEEIRKLIKENREFFTEFNTQLEQLKSYYNLDILKEDLEGVLNRYIEQYSSIFRIFKSGYKQDRNLIRSYQLNVQKNNYDQVIKDLRNLIRLRNMRNEINDKDELLKDYLGISYKKEKTDWARLEEYTEKIFALSHHLKQTDNMEKMFQFLLTFEEEDVANFYVIKEQLKKLISNIKNNVDNLMKLCSIEIPNIREDTDILSFNINELKGLILKIIYEKNKISQYVKKSNPITTEDLKKLFDLVNNIKQKESEINYLSDTLYKYYGNLYHGYETNWDYIEEAIMWAMEAYQLFSGDFPQWFVELLNNHEAEDYFISTCKSLNNSKKCLLQGLDFYKEIVSISERKFDGETLNSAGIDKVADTIRLMSEQTSKLGEWIKLQKILDESYELGLKEFLEKAELMNYELSFEHVFMKRFYKLWLDYAYNKMPILKEFQITQHNKMIEDFKQHDLKQIEINSSRVHELLTRNKEFYIENIAYKTAEIAILRREIQKQKRHKPIRRLFAEIPELLLTLKPCMMMSPLSVSQFIDPNKLKFDLIIFDEASQLRPEDAIGSFIRGKQVIIAGDDKQLPPTSFFSQQIEIDDEFIDEEDEDLYENFESILDECLLFMPQISLKWHYRSKQESLIAFSNREIYNNELYTFPNSIQGEHDGVSLVYVEDGVYDRGRSNRNIKEAEKVAQLVFEHIKRSPERSLGVIAFSEKQQEVIRDKIDEMREKHPEFEQFFSEEYFEPFFVKNLENVQGDERDTIIISIGYGKDENGVLHYNFGPLNKDGGERRLNVAITRARKEIKVVSSILDIDLDDSKLKKRGPRLLKAYLAFARNKGNFIYSTEVNNADFDSPFEEDVYNMLQKRGLELRKQVGCSGYRIDIAVVDPEKPGRYILGIECDGATYHSSKTARDRDRLRQSVLESLGWKIVRIWSQDWVKRKKEITDEIVKLVKEIMNQRVIKEDN